MLRSKKAIREDAWKGAEEMIDQIHNKKDLKQSICFIITCVVDDSYNLGKKVRKIKSNGLKR